VDIFCLLSLALEIYSYILFARIILSLATQLGGWRPPDALQPVARFLFDVTEPVLRFVRNLIPPFGMLDLSPLIVFLLIGLIRSGLPC
jgi:YggT family protein